MEADDAISDGETETCAAGLTVAVCAYPIKRPEDIGQLFFWNAGTVIADR